MEFALGETPSEPNGVDDLGERTIRSDEELTEYDICELRRYCYGISKCILCPIKCEESVNGETELTNVQKAFPKAFSKVELIVTE